MVAEGFISIKARSGHRLASVSVTGDFSNKGHFVFPGRASMPPLPYINEGSAVAWWLMPRTPDPEVGGSSPTRIKPCCVFEQGTFTP